MKNLSWSNKYRKNTQYIKLLTVSLNKLFFVIEIELSTFIIVFKQNFTFNKSVNFSILLFVFICLFVVICFLYKYKSFVLNIEGSEPK